jgi:hypothetical protein
VQRFAGDPRVAFVGENAALDARRWRACLSWLGSRACANTAGGAAELVLVFDRLPSRALLEELAEQQQAGISM